MRHCNEHDGDHHHDRGRWARHMMRHAMRRGFRGGPLEEAFEGRGPRGGRRRMFEGGELKLVLLKLLADKPRHGYDLIREIEDLSGGAYAPSPGVVYPTLTLLGDMGLVEDQQSEGARKVLAITEAGQEHLAENAEEADRAMARLAALAEVSERTDSAPIRRAMGNLKAALKDRLSQKNADRDVQLEVARLLDEAASKIERL
ncbi:PadR family transcriptional regulator [Rhizobium halophytocola]|uniref:DNA-binding PadR family transcriptional regulator n=1 Tax=Rhizobium halophytocola TaxID=735519 RepID=A0ABS4E3B4_9HYPH|nr:PadR family transcriptional regulator [Rhizobium halophytocola]MBP1852436.1 DNA-binding PadR family transcriptional regulator [Rhizobium halophytocola]